MLSKTSLMLLASTTALAACGGGGGGGGTPGSTPITITNIRPDPKFNWSNRVDDSRYTMER